MEPQAVVAMWALLILGVVVITVGLGLLIKKSVHAAATVTLVIIGFGMMGVGGFGPTFLGDYAEFVRALRSVETAESEPEQVAAATDLVNKYARGEFAQEDWPAIAATLREQRVPGLDAILASAAGAAPSARKTQIEATRLDLQRETKLIDENLAGLELNRETLGRLDRRRIDRLRNHPELLTPEIRPDFERLVNERLGRPVRRDG